MAYSLLPLLRGHFQARHGLLLGLAWVAVQAALLAHYGIVTDLEPAKYIEQAHNLIETGTVSTPNFWLYSTQIFLFAIAIKLKTGFVPIYILQLLLNGAATLYLYRLIRNRFSWKSAFTITLILICSIPVQVFTCILQTESLFFSLTLMFSCYLLQLKQIRARECIILLLWILLILFTRPTGLLFLPPLLLYLAFHFFSRFAVSWRWIIGLGGAVFLFLFLDRSLGTGGELDFMLPFQTETVICGVPGISERAAVRISENPNSLSGLLYYITHNTGQFIRLSIEKSKAFFLLVRPYYSPVHNALLLALIFPFYAFCLLSLRWWLKNNKAMLLYCSTYIFVTWLSVIMSCDDWHNRFFFTILPYIFLLSLPFIEKILHRNTA